MELKLEDDVVVKECRRMARPEATGRVKPMEVRARKRMRRWRVRRPIWIEPQGF
jgi:hypothetical protein